MRQRAQLGMALFLLNEAVLFFMLIAAFVYFRGSTLQTAAASLNLKQTTIFTACLFASSFTMWRAAAVKARAWIAATLALGVVFLVGQGGEYLRLFRQHVTISQNQFGTTFFTLTGIHALHVLAGLLALAILLGTKLQSHPGAVQAIALYWYFVDAVWIIIFATVYLWTFL
jgi:heme/copper-type cytochrome/quinol oxidase subunit 3